MPGKYIYVLDDRPPGVYYPRYLIAQTRPGPKEIIRVNRRWEIERICRRICTCGAEGILILYLVGEGFTFRSPPFIQIGEGLTQERAFHFEQLRGLWVGQHPRIEVHACYVASERIKGYTRREQGEDGYEYDITSYCRPNPNISQHVRAILGRSIPHGQVCLEGRSGPAAPGHAIMQELANWAGIQVKAGVEAQYNDFNFVFEGEVRYYNPITQYRM